MKEIVLFYSKLIFMFLLHSVKCRNVSHIRCLVLKMIMAKLGNSITILVLFCILFNR